MLSFINQLVLHMDNSFFSVSLGVQIMLQRDLTPSSLKSSGHGILLKLLCNMLRLVPESSEILVPPKSY